MHVFHICKGEQTQVMKLPSSRSEGKWMSEQKGYPWDPPISGFTAETALCEFEHLAFQHHTPKIWSCYMEDTVVLIKRNALKDFRTLLNSIFPDVQFTKEEETARQ